MNIPMYGIHPLDSAKHYYFDVVRCGADTFPRYLTPVGWSRSVHYFTSFKESDDALRLHGQDALPIVTELEYQNHQTDKDEYRRMLDQEFDEMVNLQ